MTEAKQLPPDPDGMNGDRAEWAEVALDAFRERTGTDLEDAIGDLICDLMHWCDRNGQIWAEGLRRGTSRYEAETYDEDDYCEACHRESLDCSKDPCPAVIEDRGE